MSNTEFGSPTFGPPALVRRQALGAGEPSHIHIPRPSRLRQSPVCVVGEETSRVAPLEVALDEAA